MAENTEKQDYDPAKDTVKLTTGVSKKELEWCEKQMKTLEKQALVACIKLDYNADTKQYSAEYLLSNGICKDIKNSELSYKFIAELVKLIELAEVHQAYMDLLPRLVLTGHTCSELCHAFAVEGILAVQGDYHYNWPSYNQLLDKLCGLELIRKFSELRINLRRLKWEMVLPSMTDICKRADGIKTRLELFVEVNYHDNKPSKGSSVGLPGRREDPKSTHLYPFNLDGFEELSKDVTDMCSKLRDR